MNFGIIVCTPLTDIAFMRIIRRQKKMSFDNTFIIYGRFCFSLILPKTCKISFFFFLTYIGIVQGEVKVILIFRFQK